MPLLAYAGEIRSAVLVIHGEKALECSDLLSYNQKSVKIRRSVLSFPAAGAGEQRCRRPRAMEPAEGETC